MSIYKELADEFFTKYEYPEIDELTVGFSAIDPPKKINPYDIDHEQLDGLLGGNWEGHYHLTKDLWEFVIELVNTKDFDGGFPATTEDEYTLNLEYWFEGGDADTEDYYEEVDGGGV